MTIKMLTAEMHVVQCSDRATEAYAAAAALPWWAWVRRALLLRVARVQEREMDVWAAELFVELVAEKRRHGAGA